MKSSNNGSGVAPDARHTLRCHRCRRTTGVGMVEVLAYLAAGWPRCCGEVMELQVGELRRG